MQPNFAGKTIWTGDNLDILRGLNSESVDLIYLDPPFNSNRDYSAPVGSAAVGAAFKDTWTLSDLDVAWMGLVAGEHPAMYKTLETAGMTHGKGMQSYLTILTMLAGGTQAMPTESESSASPKQSEQSGTASLLDEAPAISILQECVLGWDEAYVSGKGRAIILSHGRVHPVQPSCCSPQPPSLPSRWRRISFHQSVPPRPPERRTPTRTLPEKPVYISHPRPQCLPGPRKGLTWLLQEFTPCFCTFHLGFGLGFRT